MSHERLIATLASQATPVKPLPAPRIRTARWILVAILAIGLAIMWRGLRSNLPSALSDPTFVVTNLLILIVAVSSAWLAMTMAVPGALRSALARWVPIAGLGAWGAILIQQVATTGSLASALLTEQVVAGCMFKTYGIAIGPALVILMLAQRAAPLDWKWTASLASLSALAFGVLGTELICPITGYAHLFNWHFLPVAVMAAIVFVAAAALARGRATGR
jgi:hypothetical protein